MPKHMLFSGQTDGFSRSYGGGRSAGLKLGICVSRLVIHSEMLPDLCVALLFVYFKLLDAMCDNAMQLPISGKKIPPYATTRRVFKTGKSPCYIIPRLLWFVPAMMQNAYITPEQKLVDQVPDLISPGTPSPSSTSTGCLSRDSNH